MVDSPILSVRIGLVAAFSLGILRLRIFSINLSMTNFAPVWSVSPNKIINSSPPYRAQISSGRLASIDKLDDKNLRYLSPILWP